MGIERLTTLAFSMYANKKAYALLLGSGISCSAHILSGWEVETELIKKLASTKNITEVKDWHQWYKTTYSNPATYSSLLKELGSTPTERVQLMKGFFEPNPTEKELGWKEPTKAHKSIAQLAKEGYISVILTTNFDRLLERSLEKEGIFPQVISHVDNIDNATPIVHNKTVTIVKINGDYMDCKFRNTTEELDVYPVPIKKYVHRILEDFGLITCGWSAKYDKGLVEIINSSPTSRYNSFFTHIEEPNVELKALAISRHGEIMNINSADDLFSELYQQVMALQKINASRCMDQEMMMSRVKKFLTSNLYDIEYSDLIEKLGKEAYEKIITKAKYDFAITSEQFSNYLEFHYNAVKPLMDVAILSIRWGKPYHIALFGDILVKLCMKPFHNGEGTREDTQYLHSLGATLLFNTIGLACVKYERYAELNKLLELSVPGGNFVSNRRESLLYLLGYQHIGDKELNKYMDFNYIYPWSLLLSNSLRPHFNDFFIVDSEYENMFYIWEHLKSLLFGYMGCYASFIGFSVPTGLFLRKRIEYLKPYNAEEPFAIFFNSAEKLKNEWEPIKQGMFGGSYDEYKKIFDEAIKFYENNNRYN
ncbi:MAG: SIR2 family protein [Bacteroidales bacterium]|jgi:HEPN domain-containing protein|nr:SIR2 family protein [Paludibacter sp.]MDD3945508.1 SIR2 family protein [Bacteroidales bacterium]